VFLASRECTFSHRAIAACAGRYSRVFTGYGEGWLSPQGSSPTADDLAERMALLETTDNFFVPESSIDETIAVCRQRGIDLARG
jgi:hypothetical protein